MIQVRNLSKFYGKHAAIRDLNFDIQKGEAIGFLGLNGAGKTTTLKILGCVVIPTSGEVVVDGYDVVKQPHEVRKRIGLLPDRPPLYDDMTVGAYLKFAARMRRVAPEQIDARIIEAEELTSLRNMHEVKIDELSHGYRQRVGLAQALVHQPSLLILDEPTGGLDPIQIVEIREVLRRLKGQRTVLVSSHILSEVSQFCDRLLVIQEGSIIAQGSESELAQKFGKSAFLEVEIRGETAAAISALEAVAGPGNVTIARQTGTQAVLKISGMSELAPEMLRSLAAANIELVRLDRSASKLENIFIRLTETSA